MTIHATPKPIHGQSEHWIITELRTHYQGYTTDAPEGVPFKTGDTVRYTNPYGVTFDHVVKGFTRTCEPDDYGRQVFIFDDCWWYPVRADECELIKEGAA